MLLSNIINELNDDIIFIIQLMMVLISLIVLSRKNPMISLFFLITFYISLALLLHYYNLSILSLLYILIYVGAISVLFIFILSLMNIKDYEMHNQKYSLDWLIISTTTIYSIYLFNYYNDPLYNLRHPFKIMRYRLEDISQLINMNNYNYIIDVLELKNVGELLYTDFAIIFIILGIILLFTIISSIILVFKLNRI